ncbi:hypothetical protein RB195_015533 [Necator americanus]|uniref:SCP domain-containing protein n=1 Tax=Necator americanus TaxID=51031 RepID=A0ABR1E689_NECAM
MAATLLAAIIVVFTVTAIDATATTKMTGMKNSLISDQWRKTVLNLHNEFRRTLTSGKQMGKTALLKGADDMNELSWDYNAEVLGPITAPKNYGSTQNMISVKKTCDATETVRKEISTWWKDGATQQTSSTKVDKNDKFSQMAYFETSAVACSYYPCTATQLSLVCLYNKNGAAKTVKELYNETTGTCTCADCIAYLCPSEFTPGESFWTSEKYSLSEEEAVKKVGRERVHCFAFSKIHYSASCSPHKRDDMPLKSYLKSSGLGDNMDYASLKKDSGKQLANVIHDKTTSVGCFVKRCEKQGVIVVDCRYDPYVITHETNNTATFFGINVEDALLQVETFTKLVRPAARAANLPNPARQLVDFVPEKVLMGYLDVHKMIRLVATEWAEDKKRKYAKAATVMIGETGIGRNHIEITRMQV